MNPFRMCVGGETMYSSNQMSPDSSVKTTPPSELAWKVTKAARAASRYRACRIPARPHQEGNSLPLGQPEYHGALTVSDIPS